MVGSNVSLQMKGRNTFVILRGKLELMMALSFGTPPPPEEPLLQLANEKLSIQTSKIQNRPK